MGSSTDRETDVRAAWCRTKSTLPVTARHALRSVMLPSTNWMRSSTDSRLSTRPLDRSSSTTTSWPSVTRCSTRWEPMNPAPPVTKYFIAARTSPVGTVRGALPQVLGRTRRQREALVLRRWEGRCRYGRGPWSDERRAVPVLLLHHHRWLGPPQARGVCCHPEFLDAYLSADNRTTALDVIPADSVSMTGMMELAERVRAIAAPGVRALDGATVLVGGFAAGSLDSQLDVLGGMPRTVGLILGVTAIMLFFAFRSLLIPLKAVLLNCLSVSAAFGLTVLVFQHGYGGHLFGLEGPTRAIWGVAPVLVFATVFGLSMDYEVFLVGRVKEAFDRTGDNQHAVVEGVSATASTITSAALIMILVFGTFAFTRVLAVPLIGFGLAAAVLLDATLIRLLLAPAILYLAGRGNWWPGGRGPEPDYSETGAITARKVAV